MPGVFVSYAREDATKAQAIARALEQASFDVWFDQRMHSGSEYSREIEEALKGAAAVVVLWSRNSVESAWVRDEAAEGRDSGRLVPVLLDDARPPIGFRQFQTTDLSRWSGRGRPKQLDDMIGSVRAKVGAPPRPVAKPAVAAHWKRPVAWGEAALAAVAAGVGAFWWIGRTGTVPATAPSLAILPFTADASDTDSRKLASAAHDAVAHTLSQGAFAVSTVDTPPASGAASADYLVTGQVTSTPDKFIATVRMEEAAHRFVVFSHQFEAARGEAADFAELIGAQVASQLSWTAPLIAIERRHPSDPAITAALLQAGSAGLDSAGDLGSYEKARRLAAKAPNSPLAQNSLAFNAAFALGQLPQDQRADALALGRKAYERGIALAPEFGDNYIPWCLLHSEQRRIECEDHLRSAMRGDPDAPFANFFLASLLIEVGRNKEATELARVSLAHDPYMPHKIGISLRSLEITGQVQESTDLFQRAVRWWPHSEAVLWRRLSGMIMRGDFKTAQQFEKTLGEDGVPSAALSAIDHNSLVLMRRACSAPKGSEAPLCLLGLARFGDLDAAFGLADRIYPSRRGHDRQEEERIWLEHPDAMPTMFLASPAAAPLRRDPRFLALADRVGLLEYWRSGRLPDFCRNKPEPICPKLARG